MGFWSSLLYDPAEQEKAVKIFRDMVKESLYYIYNTRNILAEDVKNGKATEDSIKLYNQCRIYTSADEFVNFVAAGKGYSEITMSRMRRIFDSMYEKFSSDIEKYKTILEKAIKDNIKILYMKEQQLVYQDDYGRYIFDDFFDELSYFIREVIFDKSLSNEEYQVMNKLAGRIYYNELDKFLASKKIKNTKNNILTGEDYETQIGNLLKQSGFKVKLTPKTGDQGVDLIAIKNDTTIAIQCKLYSRPVGNKAVQEVIAGRGFYMCDFGCVVTNNTYTNSARKLASNQGILLLNDANICDSLEKLVMK